MTDTINERLAKLKAKIKIPSRLEKPEFQARIEKTKKHHCYHCQARLFNIRDTVLINKKLYCGKCAEYL